MKGNKQIIHIIVLLIISIFAVGATCYYMLQNYYTPASKQQSYIIKYHKNDSIRIAFIGDSWALMHKYHNCIIRKMIKDSVQKETNIQSWGIGGLTSKELYEHMFDDKEFKSFIANGFDYCIISAGVNETYRKLAPSYYKESMRFIIQFMLDNNIHPIILEIPDYDISKAYHNQKIHRKILNTLSMIKTGTPIDCKQEFRDSLSTLINEIERREEISIVSYKEWNSNYISDLRSMYQDDGIHLNERGYSVLDSCLAKHIINLIHKK